jgi:hypothetical protein
LYLPNITISALPKKTDVFSEIFPNYGNNDKADLDKSRRYTYYRKEKLWGGKLKAKVAVHIPPVIPQC